MSSDAVVRCQRCGHSLAGRPEAWTDACPLTGRCPECAAAFSWREVLRPRQPHPRWRLEGATGPVSWLIRVPAHLFMLSLRPRAVLRQLRVEHPVRPIRLLSGVLAMIAVLTLLGWTIVIVGYLRGGLPLELALRESARMWGTGWRIVLLPPPPGRPATVPDEARFLAPLTMLRSVTGASIGLLRLVVVPVVITTAAASLAFVLAPFLRPGLPVRWLHLVRLGVNGAVGMTGLGVLLVGLAAAAGRLGRLMPMEERLGFVRLATWLDVPGHAELLMRAAFLCVLPTVLAAVWWSMAARYSLRLPRPVAARVGAAVAALANLAIVAAVVLGGWMAP